MAGNSILARMAVIIDGQTASFNKAMAQSQNQLSSFTGGLKQVGAALGLTFGAAAVFNGLKQAVGIMADFEATMSEVKAITGATGKEFQDLQADALRLGASTKYTASQVGQLQVAYGRLGFNTQEILDATEATLDLAAATGEDLAKSADVAGSTVRGFGLEAKETQRVVDVMAASFNKTALGLDNFTESMKYVAPIAQAANVTVEETTALLGVLADAGIRGSSAGTALRKIFGDLSKDGRPFQERLAELSKRGITLSDSFDEVGRTAQTALLVLTKNKDKADELTRSFGDVAGEAAKMARVMQDNLAGDVTKLTSAWEGLILSLSNTSALRNATQGLTSLLGALAGGAPDAIEGLNMLAKGIKDGVTESNGGFQLLVDKIKEIRRETGKPLDVGIVQELAEKYKLTEDQANRLYRVILDVNKSLSFQEKAIKQFNEFVSRNGYKDLGKAADDYKNRLYELILAEQIHKEQLIKARQPQETIANSDKTISEYRKVIDIINQYVDTSDKAEVKVQENVKATVKDLETYKFALANLKISFKPPDLTPLTNGLKTVQETAGALTFERVVTSTEAMTRRIEASMKKLITTTKSTVKELQAAAVDLSGPIGSAFSGIAEAIGNSIAGVGDFGKDILMVVANFGKQLGEILIAQGVALLAVKLALKNPIAAIAAGVALVAISTAAGAAISKSHASTVGGGGTSVAATSNTRSISASATDAQDVRVAGETVIRGQDLYVIFSNYQNNNKFTRANG